MPKLRALPWFLFSSVCFAQAPIATFPPALRQYLELSSTQVENIVRLNNDHRQDVSQKTRRSLQVQVEIRDETNREVLDPMALGIRYAELEAIRRDLNDQLKGLRTKVRAVLNDAQRAKLKALEDASKLQPLISEALCENLLDPQVQVLPLRFSSGDGVLSGVSGVLPGLIYPSGCVFPALSITPGPRPLEGLQGSADAQP